MYVLIVYGRGIWMIDSVREIVVETIRSNRCIEITRHTNYQSAGIYMTYIDNFDDDNIIPIYIGKSNDLQRRYKQHLTQIMALNRLDSDFYNDLLFKKYYDGSLRVCKIFKYMVDHECSLKDFHMIILENVDDLDKLDQKEQEYFKLYHPAFFGFNQMNTRLEINRLGWGYNPEAPYTEDDYSTLCDIVSEDISNIYKYKEYGFTLFNFKWAFISKIPCIDGKNIEGIRTKIDEINDRISRLSEYLMSSEEKIREARKNELLIKLKVLRGEEGLIARKERELKESVITPKALSLFKDNNIKSNIAYQDFLESLLCNDGKAKNRFLKYLEKRKIDKDFYGDFQQDIEEKRNIDFELGKIKGSVGELREVLLELAHIRDFETLKMIKPVKEYEKFPLKDMYNDYVFQYDQNYSNNFCEMNIAISNNGSNKHPEIIKVDYRIINNKKIIERKNIFISNSTTESCYEKNHYYEVDYLDKFGVGGTRFKIDLIDKEVGDWSDVCISINAEIKTGINDYSIKGRELNNLSEVFNEIELNTDNYTLFVPVISESKNCLKSCFYNEDEYTLELNSVKALFKRRR